MDFQNNGHGFGQYVRVKKEILNAAHDIEGVVEDDLVGRVVSQPIDDGQYFVLVGFPTDCLLFCGSVIGYIGKAPTSDLEPVDDYISCQELFEQISEDKMTIDEPS